MRDHSSPQADDRTTRDKAEINATFQVDVTTEICGTVRIAPTALIQLIETTITEIPGVLEIRQRRRHKSDDTTAPRGKSCDDGKVGLFVDGNQIEAHISLSIVRGTNVSTLSATIRRDGSHGQYLHR